MLAFRGKRTIRGNGLGGVFSWLKRISLPLLKQVGGYLGSKLLNTGGNIISDVQSGVEPIDSLKSRVKETGNEIMHAAKNKAKKVRKALTGKGKGKGKKKKSKRPPTKKKGKRPPTKRGRKAVRIANTDLF